MAAQNNAQTISLQLEKVCDKVPLLYERDDVLLSMIQQRGDVEKVSSRNMRLPLQLVPGGKAGSYSADGGDLGRGTGSTYDVAQVSPIFFRFAVEITKLVEYASNAREKAIENAVKREIANGMKQFRAFLDKVIQTAGNGVLGTISAINGSTFTMAIPAGGGAGVGRAVKVEPGSGGGVILVVLDAKERNRLRAGETVMHDHVVDDRPRRHVVDSDCLRRGNWIGPGDAGDHARRNVAVCCQSRIVNLNRLAHIGKWNRPVE
jgi:hypothetical protein